MKVYAVVSSTTGIVAVCKDVATALVVLQGATETHKSYLPGRVVRLGRNLESLAPHQDSWHNTICDADWKTQATVEISEQDVISFK